MTTTAAVPAGTHARTRATSAPEVAPEPEEHLRLQDVAAARSWGAVDRRRDPRRRHR